MQQSATSSVSEDAVDRFVDALRRDPERADDLKRAFRRDIGLAAVHRLHPDRAAQDSAEPDDLWDNVPI